MEPILFLVHRIPFPPNKGDKIRSFHLLRHLAERYRVHLGTFVDMPEDLAHVPELDRLCASHRVEMLDPRTARLRSVSGFLTGEALTLPYYRNASLQAWVRDTVAQTRHPQGGGLLCGDGPVRYGTSRSARRAGLRRCRLSQVDTVRGSACLAVVARLSARGPQAAGLRATGGCGDCSACVFVTPGEAELFRQQAAGVHAARFT